MEIPLKDEDFSFLMMNILGIDPIHDFAYDGNKINGLKSIKEIFNKIIIKLKILSIGVPPFGTVTKSDIDDITDRMKDLFGGSSGLITDDNENINQNIITSNNIISSKSTSKSSLEFDNIIDNLEKDIYEVENIIRENGELLLFLFGYNDTVIINKYRKFYLKIHKIYPIIYKYLLKYTLILNSLEIFTNNEIAGKKTKKKKRTLRKKIKHKKKYTLKGGVGSEGVDESEDEDYLSGRFIQEGIEIFPIKDKYVVTYKDYRKEFDGIDRADKFAKEIINYLDQYKLVTTEEILLTDPAKLSNCKIIDIFSNIANSLYIEGSKDNKASYDLNKYQKEMFDTLLTNTNRQIKNKTKWDYLFGTYVSSMSVKGKSVESHILEGFNTFLKDKTTYGNLDDLKTQLENNNLNEFKDSTLRFVIDNEIKPPKNSDMNSFVTSHRLYNFAGFLDGGTNNSFNSSNGDYEIGNMKFEFVRENNKKESYSINIEKNGDDMIKLTITANLKMNKRDKFLKIDIEDHNLSIKTGTIKLEKNEVYANSLNFIFNYINPKIRFSWNDLINADDFVDEFVSIYHMKGIGDFLQELTAILNKGGYIKNNDNPSYKKNTKIVRFDNSGNNLRLFLANDTTSSIRYMFLKSILDEKYKNTKSYGGFSTSTQFLVI